MDNFDTIDKYDRLYGAMHDVALLTKPSTIKHVQSLTGRTETFVIQTARHEENGDYIFLRSGWMKPGWCGVALPPRVANIIASQREALTKRRRSLSSKAVMKARMDAGEVIGFQRSSKTRINKGSDKQTA